MEGVSFFHWMVHTIVEVAVVKTLLWIGPTVKRGTSSRYPGIKHWGKVKGGVNQ